MKLLAVVLALAAGSPAKDPALTHAVAYWRSKCASAPSEVMWMKSFPFDVLYGNCNAGDGTDQRVFFFDGGRFVGTDGLGSSRGIIGLWRDSNTIAFMYVLYRPGDPNCCATGGGAIVRYRLANGHVRRLDPAPSGR